jgi:predicted Rossmann fold nucleotide-binding protein DprA/Smf involved in DNA uptake
VEDFLYETRMDRGHRTPIVRRQAYEKDSSPVGGSALWGSVLAALEGGATSADGVAAQVGTGVREIIVALSEMEIEGLVVRAGPGLYIRAP